MQQFNPWLFAGSQQQGSWPFNTMANNPFATAAPLSNFGMGSGDQQYNQMMQYWQQQMQQMPYMATFQPLSSTPFDLSKRYADLQNTIAMNQQFICDITQKLFTGADQSTDSDQLRKALFDYFKHLVQTSWQDADKIVHSEAATSWYRQMKTGVQWTLEQLTAAPASNSEDMEKFKKTLSLWLDLIDSVINMSAMYHRFTEQACADLADKCIDSLDKKEMTVQDGKKLFSFFVRHYEQYFTEWLQTDEYCHTYGKVVNCSSAVRKDQQSYIDDFVEAFGLPSKQEMDTTHKRAHEQGRRLRNIRDKINNLIEQQEADKQDTDTQIKRVEQLCVSNESKIDSLQNRINILGQEQTDRLAELHTKVEQLSTSIQKLAIKAKAAPKAAAKSSRKNTTANTATKPSGKAPTDKSGGE